MTEIPASLVKELRERTGAGMMDCKRALVETSGDIEAAIKLLREQGIARPRSGPAARRPRARSSSTSRRRTSARWSPSAARPSPSRTTPSSWLRAAGARGRREARPEPRRGARGRAGRARRQARREHRRRADAVRYQGEDGDVLTAYVHPPANKLGVLVHARGDGDQAYRSSRCTSPLRAPLYVHRDDVPEAEIDAEREILAKQPDVQDRSPSEVREKIVEGRMLSKWSRGDRARGAGLDPRHGKRVGDGSPRRARVIEFERCVQSTREDSVPRFLELQASVSGGEPRGERSMRGPTPDRPRVPARPAEALRRGPDPATEDFGIDQERDRLARRRDRRGARERASSSRIVVGGGNIIRGMERGRGRHGPLDRRLRGDARDACSTRSPSRTRSSAAAPQTRVLSAIDRRRGGRAVHPPPRDPPPREGARS